MDELAEVGARLGFGGIGPEREGQLLARDRRVGRQRQMSEQGLQVASAQRSQRPPVDGDTKGAQHFDPDRWDIGKSTDSTARFTPPACRERPPLGWTLDGVARRTPRSVPDPDRRGIGDGFEHRLVAVVIAGDIM